MQAIIVCRKRSFLHKVKASENREFMRGKLPLSRVFFLIIVIAALSGGCEKKDDASLVPSYLYIEKIGLNTQYEQGTASHKITDAWVYVDETLIGAFELPATIPS